MAALSNSEKDAMAAFTNRTEQDIALGYLAKLKNPDRDVASEPIPADPSFLWKLVHLNPALWRGIVFSVIGLLATAGLVISNQTGESVVTLILSVTAIVQAIWTRSATTPNKKVLAYKPDPIDHATLISAGEAVSTDVAAVANAAATSSVKPATLPFPVTGDWIDNR